MTDAVKKMNDNLDKRQTTLLSKTSSLKAKIEERKTMSKHVLLCDVSGSMGRMVTGSDGETRAIDIVQSVVYNFAGANIYAFHSHCDKVPNGSTDIGQPRGGTQMHIAFKMMHMQGHKQVTLLTDGAPNNSTEAIKAAKGLVLNIIYIGPPPCPQFLEDLAKSTGGTFDTAELINSRSFKAELTSKIKGLLGA